MAGQSTRNTQQTAEAALRHGGWVESLLPSAAKPPAPFFAHCREMGLFFVTAHGADIAPAFCVKIIRQRRV
jgi:hypothetical protein